MIVRSTNVQSQRMPVSPLTSNVFIVWNFFCLLYSVCSASYWKFESVSFSLFQMSFLSSFLSCNGHVCVDCLCIACEKRTFYFFRIPTIFTLTLRNHRYHQGIEFILDFRVSHLDYQTSETIRFQLRRSPPTTINTLASFELISNNLEFIALEQSALTCTLCFTK